MGESSEHEGSDNLVCFGMVIDFHENYDEEAWYRVLDAFIDAVEAEGACAAGGMHATGSMPPGFCQDCDAPEEEEE